MPRTPLIKKSAPSLTILPATSDLWPAIEDLFGPKGACNNCWCMYWRNIAAILQQKINPHSN